MRILHYIQCNRHQRRLLFQPPIACKVVAIPPDKFRLNNFRINFVVMIEILQNRQNPAHIRIGDEDVAKPIMNQAPGNAYGVLGRTRPDHQFAAQNFRPLRRRLVDEKERLLSLPAALQLLFDLFCIN